ncbi:30S ribosomal subunit protein S10 [Candidatus Tremblaya phenacola PAVE]|nr:30S ribosomal subunit protein S10 [Candidatus Tremblaya phenacola PAVE]
MEPIKEIRLMVKSHNRKLLNEAVTKILTLAASTGSKTGGAVSLPTKIKKLSVLRSPHIDKDSRDQLEMRTHKKLITVSTLQTKTLEQLMRTELPPEINIEVKTI